MKSPPHQPPPVTSRGKALYLRDRIRQRIGSGDSQGVWSPVDFLDLAPREAVDKALQRLANTHEIRRIDRGLYDQPGINPLTGKTTVPDFRRIIDAVARRDRLRVLIDPATAAHQLGWTTSVPARAVVQADRRLRPIKLGNLIIEFGVASPSRLYWAGRPAMALVQAIRWVRDLLPHDKDTVDARIRTVISDPDRGKAMLDDLREGWNTLPAWMHALLRPAIRDAEMDSSAGSRKEKNPA